MDRVRAFGRARTALWLFVTLCLLLVFTRSPIRWLSQTVLYEFMGGRTIHDAIAEFGDGARTRIAPDFQRAGVSLPPVRIALLAFKAERRLELWASDGAWTHIKDYPILAASGGAGPKLREGDLQVPEGVYAIELLNPQSSYHLSLRLDYPNAFDRAKAAEEGRTNPGGDIYIHGGNLSIGCLAIGDSAIEELFCLVAETGKENVQVIIAPHDFRVKSGEPVGNGIAWTAELYAEVKESLAAFAR